VVAVVLVTGCRKREEVIEAPPPTPGAVQPGDGFANPELDLSAATVPESFKVEANESSTLVLGSVDPASSARVHVEVVRGDLKATARRHQTHVEADLGGTYRGSQQVEGPLGPAIWSRGEYDEDGEAFEEGRLITSHPSGQGTLTLTYKYPAGEQEARKQELLALLEGMKGG